MLNFDFYNVTSTKIPSSLFGGLLQLAHAQLIKDKKITARQNFTFELSLVGKSRIRQLNKKYHHKDKETDVISISFFESKMKDTFIGEIFISLPFAQRQAQKIGQSLSQELQFLFIHGLLHLFGYDHMKETEEKHMKSLTYKILGRM